MFIFSEKLSLIFVAKDFITVSFGKVFHLKFELNVEIILGFKLGDGMKDDMRHYSDVMSLLFVVLWLVN